MYDVKVSDFMQVDQGKKIAAGLGLYIRVGLGGARSGKSMDAYCLYLQPRMLGSTHPNARSNPPRWINHSFILCKTHAV